MNSESPHGHNERVREVEVYLEQLASAISSTTTKIRTFLEKKENERDLLEERVIKLRRRVDSMKCLLSSYSGDAPEK